MQDIIYARNSSFPILILGEISLYEFYRLNTVADFADARAHVLALCKTSHCCPNAPSILKQLSDAEPRDVTGASRHENTTRRGRYYHRVLQLIADELTEAEHVAVMPAATLATLDGFERAKCSVLQFGDPATTDEDQEETHATS